jgi:16S rRNA (adenine1518-N6/adenine1519-N6)-dimethyltransferase
MISARLGQHFLINRDVARKMAQVFSPGAGAILEIGPGKGVLTDYILRYRKNNRLILVERDPALCEELRERYGSMAAIVCSNILTVDPNDIVSNEKLYVIGNLPYYISRSIIDWVVKHHRVITKGTFMMQKEFVEKLIVEIKSPQAILFRHLYNPEKCFEVSSGSFFPPPKVKSVVFAFDKIPGHPVRQLNVQNYYRFLKGCFSSRRKTLFNNLSSIYPAPVLLEIFKREGLTLSVRGEEMEKDFLLRIFRSLEED